MKPGLQISVPEDFLILELFKSDLPFTDFLVFKLNLWGFFLAGTLWKYFLPPLGSHFSLFMQLEGTPAYLRLLLVYLFEVNQHIQYLLEEWAIASLMFMLYLITSGNMMEIVFLLRNLQQLYLLLQMQ